MTAIPAAATFRDPISKETLDWIKAELIRPIISASDNMGQDRFFLLDAAFYDELRVNPAAALAVLAMAAKRVSSYGNMAGIASLAAEVSADVLHCYTDKSMLDVPMLGTHKLSAEMAMALAESAISCIDREMLERQMTPLDAAMAPFRFRGMRTTFWHMGLCPTRHYDAPYKFYVAWAKAGLALDGWSGREAMAAALLHIGASMWDAEGLSATAEALRPHIHRLGDTSLVWDADVFPAAFEDIGTHPGRIDEVSGVIMVLDRLAVHAGRRHVMDPLVRKFTATSMPWSDLRHWADRFDAIPPDPDYALAFPPLTQRRVKPTLHEIARIAAAISDMMYCEFDQREIQKPDNSHQFECRKDIFEKRVLDGEADTFINLDRQLACLNDDVSNNYRTTVEGLRICWNGFTDHVPQFLEEARAEWDGWSIPAHLEREFEAISRAGTAFRGMDRNHPLRAEFDAAEIAWCDLDAWFSARFQNWDPESGRPTVAPVDTSLVASLSEKRRKASEAVAAGKHMVVVLKSIGDPKSTEGAAIATRFESLTIPSELRRSAVDADTLHRILQREFPWMSEANEAAAKQVGFCALGEWFRWSPQVLWGSPGVGKTRWSRRFAETIGLGYGTLSLAGTSTSMGITGSERGWSSARPSFPALAMMGLDCPNPVLLIDEIDKAGSGDHNGNPLDAMLPLLDSETSARYHDRFLLGNMDVSHVVWIATANLMHETPPAFRKRFTAIKVGRPEAKHIQPIITSMAAEIAADHGIRVENLPDYGDFRENIARNFLSDVNMTLRDMKSSLVASLSSKSWTPPKLTLVIG